MSNYALATGDFKVVPIINSDTLERPFDRLIRKIYTPYDSLFFKGLTGANVHAQDLSWVTHTVRDTVFIKSRYGDDPLSLAMAVPPLHFILDSHGNQVMFLITVVVMHHLLGKRPDKSCASFEMPTDAGSSG